MRDAIDVARRCLALELCAQRLVLETDEEASTEEREGARRAWASRAPDLGVTLLPGEEALMHAPVGSLSDEQLDDLDGRASAAPVLLWALGRLEARPSFATSLADALDEAGLLGDGSLSAARAAAEAAKLRDEKTLGDAVGAYRRTRGKAKETDEPEKIFAELAAEMLSWVLDPSATLAD